MLFVLIMECFHALTRKANSQWLLQQLGWNNFHFRAFLYADDVVVFFSLTELDLQVIKGVLPFSKENLALQQTSPRVMPIASTARMRRSPWPAPRTSISSSIADFPCTYLGVTLSINRIPKAALQMLVDKIVRHLPWQGRLLNQCGCLVLAKITISTVLVHIYMVISIAPWDLKAVEMLIRGCL